MDKNIERIVKVYRETDTPFFLSVVLAQYMIESTNGTSELATNAQNYFGHKIGENWNGPIYYKDATEEENGKMVNVGKTAWRKYASLEECVADHLNWLTQTEWYKNYYADAINAKTYQEQAEILEGKYATASHYAESIIEKIETLKLYEYDEQKGEVKMTINYPRFKFDNLLPEKNMYKVLGAIVHNDYGSKLGKPEWYYNWLKNRDKTLGIAHVYGDRFDMGRYVDTFRIAYHAGNWDANAGGYIGYEVCQSRWDNGESTENFLLNEDMVLRQVAEDFHYYGLKPNRQTVRLHKEFSPTSCPHRSWDLHGKEVNAVKDYFIKKIAYYMSLGKTVKEIIDAENKGVKAPAPKPIDNARTVKPPKYKVPANLFKELKTGDKVTIRPGMTYWYMPADGSGVKPSKDFAGKRDVIAKVIDIKGGTHYSKRAYLLKGLNSWILEQDLVEARVHWVKVEGNESKENTTPNVITSDDEGYFYLKGVKYKVSEVKE